MGKNKNMKLIPSLFKKNKEETSITTSSPTQPWQWPLCKHPKTLSFRAAGGNDIFKTVNSVFFDNIPDTPVSGHCLNSSELAASISTDSDEHCTMGRESVEMIIRGARWSERLFFKPGDTSSVLSVNEDTATMALAPPFKESVAMDMESEDPYGDFKKSMEEMVESHGLKDLEELLGWYLRMNGKNNHEFIVAAFVDLLVGIASSSTNSSSSSSHSTCYSSAPSTFSSPSTSPLSLVLLSQKEIDEEKAKMVVNLIP